MPAMTDYLENKLIDQLFRGQAYGFPATLHFALFTAAPTDAGGGTEVTGGSYARVPINATLANFAGTQSAGSTAASSGATGTTSNNVAITFPAPTANWGTVGWIGIFDALNNLLWWNPLAAQKTINNGDAPPSFATGAFTCQLDA